MDETPRHLNSRTRKRFKQDRPDEQSIYDKTIRWLFSAQKKLYHQEEESTPATANDETLVDVPPSSLPDPNQRTLRSFFQPVRHSSYVPSNGFPNNPSTQSFASQTSKSNPGAQVDLSLHNVSSSVMDIDMDVSMEKDSGSNSTVSTPGGNKRWVGGLGWMWDA
ncbi:predicted protein [Uncinocarpus reesii 1704]|uniref:Uncharacterized protein n=1 Tax=Uncinocarpus reesii (strain UAMH 1704) TaxID=336963 RepID=C4JFB8_UNCRE|nr:uncharacterized protein UREG_02340 [Uncinocarpus reesii 1704]EEP77491.1 predicted protein [Uncinocarpus reesii 1704]